jgi:hypothetical protein
MADAVDDDLESCLAHPFQFRFSSNHVEEIGETD